MKFVLKQRSILPGFGLSLGFTVFYLCLIVLIPLSAVFLKTSTLSWHQFWRVVLSPRALRIPRTTSPAPEKRSKRANFDGGSFGTSTLRQTRQHGCS